MSGITEPRTNPNSIDDVVYETVVGPDVIFEGDLNGDNVAGDTITKEIVQIKSINNSYSTVSYDYLALRLGMPRVKVGAEFVRYRAHFAEDANPDAAGFSYTVNGSTLRVGEDVMHSDSISGQDIPCTVTGFRDLMKVGAMSDYDAELAFTDGAFAATCYDHPHDFSLRVSSSLYDISESGEPHYVQLKQTAPATDTNQADSPDN
jgi:hypothetical protein